MMIEETFRTKPKWTEQARNDLERLLITNKRPADRAIALACIALEKQVPKKPNIWGDGVDEQGNLIYDMYDCTNCYKSYEIDYERYDYCPHCGQALLWEE